jgi:hypothetical protein
MTGLVLLLEVLEVAIQLVFLRVFSVNSSYLFKSIIML